MFILDRYEVEDSTINFKRTWTMSYFLVLSQGQVNDSTLDDAFEGDSDNVGIID